MSIVQQKLLKGGFMGKRSKKRKSKVFLEDAIRSTKKEIEVLKGRLGDGSCSSDERRICCLMNKTLPNLQNHLVSLEQKEFKQAWIQ
jgi:hypothetical protein